MRDASTSSGVTLRPYMTASGWRAPLERMVAATSASDSGRVPYRCMCRLAISAKLCRRVEPPALDELVCRTRPGRGRAAIHVLADLSRGDEHRLTLSGRYRGRRIEHGLDPDPGARPARPSAEQVDHLARVHPLDGGHDVHSVYVRGREARHIERASHGVEQDGKLALPLQHLRLHRVVRSDDRDVVQRISAHPGVSLRFDRIVRDGPSKLWADKV